MEKRPTWTGTQIAVLVILIVTTNAVTASIFFFMPEAEVTGFGGDEVIQQKIIYSETEFRVSFDYRGQSATLDSYRYLRVMEDRFEKEWILGMGRPPELKVESVIYSANGVFVITVITDRTETRITNANGDITVDSRHTFFVIPGSSLNEDSLVRILEIDNSYGHTPVETLYVLIKNFGYRNADMRVEAIGCDVEGNVVQVSGHDSHWMRVIAKTICS